LEKDKIQLETVTIKHGDKKIKWANLFHDSNQKVTTIKLALRSAESKITNLEMQLQLANNHISRADSPDDPPLQVVGQKGKGLLLEVGQPSGMHEAEKEATPLAITTDLLLDLTEYVPPTSNVEHGYAFDRQVLFLVLNLNWRDTLSNSQFRTV
jgi:hypothetical protein